MSSHPHLLPAVLRFGTGTAHAATTLKISHQFPGGTIDKGDFRDRLCHVRRRSRQAQGGEIAAEIYPNSSLIKTNAQFSAMRKGALDISLYPMPYAGGELPETNIGLMPGLVATYDQGLRWKKEPVGKALTDFLADRAYPLTWVWQAGGVASRSKPIVAPEDAKGMKGAAARAKWTWCCRPRALPCCRCRRTKSTPRCRPAPVTPASPPPPA
jgi:TRAP-type C4-dicarboxylate transport system substrate-binding protein